jgi:predicted AAA+ superfamily ATPase
MHGVLQPARIRYWRDKRGHEIDFVYSERKRAPVAIECEWSSADFDSKNLQAFRRHYLEGLNFVVANDITRRYERSYDGIKVWFVDLPALLRGLQESG